MTDKHPISTNELYNQVVSLKQEIAHLQAQLNRKPVHAYLRTLNEIATILMQRADIEDLLDIIIEQSTRLAETTHGFIYLLESDEKTMRARSASGLFKSYLGEIMIPDRGVVGHVWRTGEPLTISDYENWSGRVPFDTGDEFYAAAAFPLKSNDVVIGVLALVYEEHGREFDDDIIELLVGFADLATIALSNARLYHELKENRRFTERVLDTVPEIVRVHDYQKKQLIFANDAITRVLGYTLDEINKMTPEYQDSTIHPDDFALWKDAHFRALQAQDGEIVEVDYRIRNRDGQWRWLHRNEIVFQRSHDGSVNQILAVIYDITEQKETQIELQRQAHLLTIITDAIVSTDKDFRIESWNAGAEKLYGWKADEAIGKPILEIISIEYLEGQTATQIYEDLLSQGFWEGELIQYHRDGSRLRILNSTTLITDNKGNMIGSVAVSRDITERKRIEDDLRENQYFITKVMDTVPEIIRVHDIHQNKAIYANTAHNRLLGYEFEQIRKMEPASIEELIHPDDLGSWRVMMASFANLKDEDIYELIYRIRHVSGDWRWFWRRDVVFQRDERGNPSQILNVTQDITEQKQAEIALIASEERFRTIFHSAAVGIALTDEGGRILDCNPVFGEMLGYSAEEMRALTYESYNFHEHAQVEKQLMQELLTGKRAYYHIEKRLKHKMNQIIWVRATNSIMTDGDHNIGLIIMEDITERRYAEQALKDSEERFRTLVESTHAIVFLYNAQAGMTYISPACELILGFKPRELMGKGFLTTIHQRSLSELLERMQQYTQTGTVEEPDEEIKVVAKNGQVRWLDLSIAQLEIDGVSTLLGTAIDISERKRAEVQAVAFTLEKQKVQLISEFITNVSHDFRTPLSTLNTSLYLLERDQRPERKQDRIDTMRNEIQHLEKLVEGLLTMTRLDSHETAMNTGPTDVNEILREVVTRITDRTAAKNQHLGFVAQPLELISVDGVLLHQALLNLVDNAINFTPPGGAIYLSAERHDQDEELLIIVRDNGIGISPEDAPHIFERFYQADKSRSTRRVGLGLPIAQKIIEIHGGTIDFESQEGQGSTFTIHLPLSKRHPTSK